jgi:hypothetical protein
MWFPKHAGPVLGLADGVRAEAGSRPVRSLASAGHRDDRFSVGHDPDFPAYASNDGPSTSFDAVGTMFPARPGPTLAGNVLSGHDVFALSTLDLEVFTLELLQALMLERYESEARFNGVDGCAIAVLNRDFWASNLLRARAATPTRCKDTKPPILGVDEDAPSEPDPECQKNERWIARLEQFVAIWEAKLRELGCPGWT